DGARGSSGASLPGHTEEARVLHGHARRADLVPLRRVTELLLACHRAPGEAATPDRSRLRLARRDVPMLRRQANRLLQPVRAWPARSRSRCTTRRASSASPLAGDSTPAP